MTRDPLDRLRDADPLRGRDVPTADAPEARAMREAVLAGEVGEVGILDAARRRRRWVAAGAAVAAAVATAAAIAVTTSRVEDPTRVGCYAAASTRADTVVVTAGEGGPVATCVALWAEGELDPDVTTEDAVPPLTACVLDSGVVGVFPVGSCDDVTDEVIEAPTSSPTPTTSPTTAPETASPSPADDGTGLPLPDYGTADDRVRRAMEEIRTRLLDRCLTLEAAIEVGEDALAAEGLEGWSVGSVLDDHPEGTCAGFFPDVAEQAVRFVPEDPAPGQTPEG